MTRQNRFLIGTLFVVLMTLFLVPQETFSIDSGKGKDIEKSEKRQIKAPEKPSIKQKPQTDIKQPVIKKKETHTEPPGGSRVIKEPDDPLAIARIFMEDGTIHVTLNAGAKGIPASSYVSFQLEVQTKGQKIPTSWSLMKVDPRRQLTRKRGRATFNTKLGLKNRGRVTATLSRGLWKAEQSATLSPSPAQKASSMGLAKRDSSASRKAKLKKLPTKLNKKEMGTLQAEASAKESLKRKLSQVIDDKPVQKKDLKSKLPENMREKMGGDMNLIARVGGISVTDPDSGWRFRRGDLMTVTWRDADDDDDVDATRGRFTIEILEDGMGRESAHFLRTVSVEEPRAVVRMPRYLDTLDLPRSRFAILVSKADNPEVYGMSSALLRGNVSSTYHNIMLPRGNETHMPGREINVNWNMDDCEGGQKEGVWSVHLRRSGDETFNHDLFSGFATPGTAVSVELPEELDEANDYYIQVIEHHVEENEANSRHFSIIPGGGDLGGSVVERQVRVLNPEEGEVIDEGEAYNYRWRVMPRHLPVPDQFHLRFISEATSTVVYAKNISSARASAESLYDPETGIFAEDTIVTRDFEPGESYRLEIEAVYDEVSGSAMSGSFTGQSGVYTFAPAPEGEGVTLLEPGLHLDVFPGDDIPVSWEINPDYVEAYGEPEFIIISVFKGFTDPHREVFPDELEDEASVFSHVQIDDPPLSGSYAFPSLETFEHGPYSVEIYARMPHGYSPSDKIYPIHMMPNRGLYFLAPFTTPQNLYRGNDYTVSWRAMGDAEDHVLDIQLCLSGVVLEYLARDIPASRGSWEWDGDAWDIVEGNPPGGGYYLLLSSMGDDGHAYGAESGRFHIH